ncbi:MAG TPA: hypothetical protein VLB50_00515, partial [Ignavibacteriaceae bacterium]|nr:hypothetical protein [Ignavibacteriaceae bacterium]
MNLSSKILFIMIVFFAFNVWAQDCAHLQVKTDLPSSKIYVDSVLAGEGNIELRLTNGTHNIVVLEESDRWDAKSFNDNLIIRDCKDTVLNYSF